MDLYVFGVRPYAPHAHTQNTSPATQNTSPAIVQPPKVHLQTPKPHIDPDKNIKKINVNPALSYIFCLMAAVCGQRTAFRAAHTPIRSTRTKQWKIKPQRLHPISE